MISILTLSSTFQVILMASLACISKLIRIVADGLAITAVLYCLEQGAAELFFFKQQFSRAAICFSGSYLGLVKRNLQLLRGQDKLYCLLFLKKAGIAENSVNIFYVKVNWGGGGGEGPL